MQTNPVVTFREPSDSSEIQDLKGRWQRSLHAQQDGMWETLTNLARDIVILKNDKIIGYASIDDTDCLLQFYLVESCLHQGNKILLDLARDQQVERALVGTHNPIFLSAILPVHKTLKVHTLLFQDSVAIHSDDSFGHMQLAKEENLDDLVEFYHVSMDGPKEWLSGYLGNLIQRSELYFLNKGQEIIGGCEVRKSDSNADYADLGMVVSPAHRKKGLGTWLLGKAKSIALTQNKKPICSCEAENMGSLKAIEQNGFRSIHQMLLITI